MMALGIRLLWGGLAAIIEFVAKPANWVILGIVCLFVYGYASHSGRVKERGIWVAKIEAERKAQTAITNAHEALAIKEAQELQDQVENQNAIIEELRKEAAASPDAGKPAISITGVRRVNRGR